MLPQNGQGPAEVSGTPLPQDALTHTCPVGTRMQSTSDISNLNIVQIQEITAAQFTALDARDRDIAELLEEQEVWLMSR